MGEENASRLIRFAAGGVVLWTAGQMARMLYLGVLEGAPGTRVWIITATAIYLPLQVVLVLRAVRNVRPRSSWWLLAGVALAIVGSLPLGGVVWIPVMSVLAGLLLIYFRPPWSLLLFLAAVALSIVMVLFGPHNGYGGRTYEYVSFDTVDVVWGGVAMAVLVWLVRGIRELEVARQHLAARAVVVERRRIDDEVDRTVGAALARIIASGEAAAGLVRDDPDAAARELSQLTAKSRRALAEARGVLTGYREVSLEAELRAAATLLAAAGIAADVELPGAGLPPELPEPLRARLRTLVAQALGDHVVTECVLTITWTGDGGLDIELVSRSPLAGAGAA